MFADGFSDTPDDTVTVMGPRVISKASGKVILTVESLSKGSSFCTITVRSEIAPTVAGFAKTPACDDDP